MSLVTPALFADKTASRKLCPALVWSITPHTAGPSPAVADALSALPPELLHRILQLIDDPRALARLGRASSGWARRTAADPLWRSLFLARWPRAPPPFSLRRLRGHRAPASPSSSSSSSSNAPDNNINGINSAAVSRATTTTATPAPPAPSWKQLYASRHAVHARWRRGTPPTERRATAPLGRQWFVVAAHPGGSWVVTENKGGGDNLLRVVDAASWTCVRVLQAAAQGGGGGGGALGQPTVLCVDTDGAVVAAGTADRRVVVWDAATGRRTMILGSSAAAGGGGHGRSVRHVRVEPFCIVSFSTADRVAVVWDRATGAAARSFVLPEPAVTAVAARGGTLASLSTFGAVKLWSLATGACERVLVAGGGRADEGWVFRFDGARVALKGSGTPITVWDARTGACVREIRGGNEGTWELCLDGGRLADMGAEAVEVWEVETGLLLHRFEESFTRFNHMSATALYARLTQGPTVIWDIADGIPHANEF
ncbi:WD40-repeat-containing domain protein [Zopfochytrium polystomum]|nr:WD40-repeat-containing domain protein [Zopfochytrium polystomum]